MVTLLCPNIEDAALSVGVYDGPVVTDEMQRLRDNNVMFQVNTAGHDDGIAVRGKRNCLGNRSQTAPGHYFKRGGVAAMRQGQDGE